MTKSIAYCTLLVSAAIAIILAVYEPTLLSDDNIFLKDFVNHEFLNLLGVILAITLASTAQLHLTLNKIEETYKQRGGLNKTRGGVQKAAHWLIGLFLSGVAVVVIKPLLATTAWQQSAFNSIAIIIIVWNVLILIIITRTIFRIEPTIDDE